MTSLFRRISILTYENLIKANIYFTNKHKIIALRIYTILPALIRYPTKALRETLVLCPNKKSHLTLRKGKWLYIGAQGAAGFTKSPDKHGAGGAPCVTYVGDINSDIEDGRIKENPPSAQLYNLEADLKQTTNLHDQHPEGVEQMKLLLNE